MSLKLQRTEGITFFLDGVAEDRSLPQNVRDQAMGLAEGEEVAWKDLRDLAATLRGEKAGGRDVWLHQICSGSGVALQGPKPRAKSPALQARLAELQKKLEQHQYDVMLQGIAEKEFGAGNDDEGGLSTYKAQLSIGLHIVVMMGTFFAAGFHGESYLSNNPLHQLVGGLIGLILAMLMETVLLIIRTTVSPRSKAEEILLRHDREMQEAKLRKEQVRERDQNGADDEPEEARDSAAKPASNSKVKKDQ